MSNTQIIRLVFAAAAAIAVSACNGNQNIKVDGPAALADGVPGAYTIEYSTAVPAGADPAPGSRDHRPGACGLAKQVEKRCAGSGARLVSSL